MNSLRTYVRRLRMERALSPDSDLALPRGVKLTPWRPELLDAHAEVLWESFRGSLDAAIFPNLGHLAGCLYLMEEVTRHEWFLPEATWLVRDARGNQGCIQGLATRRGHGMIQNLAVAPGVRRLGLGKALLCAALAGFRDAGMRLAQLEVSSRNLPAVRLYHALGFEVRKTLHREVREPQLEYSM